MELRQSLKLAILGGVPAALALAALAIPTKGPGATPSIVAEPAAPPAPVVAPEEAPQQLPGMLVRRFGTDPVTRGPHTRRTPLRLELLDPWNGEDLAPVLAAMERPRLDVDRVDPWDPRTQYPFNPGLGDPPSDTRDPWQQTASLESNDAPVAAKKPVLDRSSPWDAAPAPAVATDDTTANDEPTL